MPIVDPLDAASSESRVGARLWFIGDLCLTDEAEERCLADRGYRALSGLGGLIGEGDVVAANVEYAISDRGERSPLKFAGLRANPGTVPALSGLGVAVLGNNHVGDYGPVAASDTVGHLEAAGIRAVGLGEDLRGAVRPVTVEVGGARIGIVSFCCPTANAAAYADPYAPGVAPLVPGVVQPAIAEARSGHDLVVAYMHWGDEQQHFPVAEQLRLGRRAIDWGANAVVGCHAHVIQAYESYKGRWIFHGLGNFIFPDIPWSYVGADGTLNSGIQAQAPRNRESLLVALEPAREAGGWGFRLGAIEPLVCGGDFVPRPARPGELTVDPRGLSDRLGEVVARSGYLLDSDEFNWRTFYLTGYFAHRYLSPPVDRDPAFARRSVGRRVIDRIYRGVARAF